MDEFGRSVVANYLRGADAHAKNYSVMLAASAVQFADLYDVASGLTATRDGQLRYPKGAMSIGGETAFGEVRGLNWTHFATALEVSAHTVRDLVLTLADRGPQAVSDAIRALPAQQRRQPELRPLAERVRILGALTLRDVDDLSAAGRHIGTSGSETLAGAKA